MNLKVALSPCPNDTYLFYGWIAQEVGRQLPIEPVFGDIQHLNQWAAEKTFPLIKLSFNCFANLLDTYQLLPIGSALGFNCGPKIIAKKPFSLDELRAKTVAIPGKDTTAHLLLDRFFPDLSNKHFCLYHEIATVIENGEADCGVIIHESRFTFQQRGFYEIVDLGELWHQKTTAPLPLGGLAVHRGLPDRLKQGIVEALRLSLRFTRTHPEKAYPFILEHAQDKSVSVVQKHIDTYVTAETESLSPKGIEAIQNLLACPRSIDWLYDDPHPICTIK